MKVICNGYELADAVSKVFKAVGSKVVNPVLEGIKIKAEDGTINLVATDTEISIEKNIPAEVIVEGVVVVPGRIFAEFVKKLNTDSVELSHFEGNKLKIRYGESEGTLNCLPAEEFPVIKPLGKEQSFSITSKNFRELINKVSFSVSQDDSRPMLKGVLFEIEEATITAVAIDGYRLAKYVKPIEKSSGLMRAVVPARCLNEISRIAENADDIVSVSVQKNYMMVDFIHTIVITRLLTGDFINYKQIIPQRFETMVTVPREAFEDGLDRAILMARTDRNNLVKFEMNENLMRLSSDSEMGNVFENIKIKLDGHDLAIAFNARYFTELAKYLSSECITLKFNDSVQPCVIVPTDGTEDLLYLVLPVRMIG